MKLFPQDDGVILYETDFEDDVLDRNSISKQLSELVDRIEDPIVIALDDKWGSGKTFFLKRWVAAHTTQNNGTATTIYFDAFENDYLTDPLISIITAVSERIADKQQKTVNEWKTVATKLAKPALAIALSIVTAGAKQHLDEIGDMIADTTSAEAKDAIKDIWQVEKDRKDAMLEFRKLLSELTQTQGAPIVIVVDELDRCRPDYALTVLEVIKHFFSVPKVHFILGVNGTALESIVKARYGAEIDAESYLRKFINLSFSLPRAFGERGEVSVIEKYASTLIDDMGLHKHIPNHCVSLLKCVAHTRDVSLRDIGKILSKIALMPEDVHKKDFFNKQFDVDTLCALVVTSVIDPQLHAKLVAVNAETSELRNYLSAPAEKTMKNSGTGENTAYDSEVTNWLAILIFCCGKEEIEEVQDLPSHWKTIGKTHDGNHLFGDRKSIAPRIQKDYIEIFKI